MFILVEKNRRFVVTEFVKVLNEFDTHLKYFDLQIKLALKSNNYNYNSFSFLKTEAYRNLQ